MRKTLLITGGSNGLGLEIVKKFLKKGYNVINLDRNELLENNLNEIESRYLSFYRIDLGDVEQMKIFAQSLHQNNVMIDVLVLNAAPRVFKNFDTFTHREICDLSNASLVSSLILLNTTLAGMKTQRRGKLIVISSKSGFKGYSSGSLYCAFKSAWITLHESIARELKDTKNISILTVCPDSFSSRVSSEMDRDEKLINRIILKIVHSISDSQSQLYFPASFKAKIAFVLVVLNKLKLIIK
jgi:short-subunit dehydrogenase